MNWGKNSHDETDPWDGMPLSDRKQSDNSSQIEQTNRTNKDRADARTYKPRKYIGKIFLLFIVGIIILWVLDPIVPGLGLDGLPGIWGHPLWAIQKLAVVTGRVLAAVIPSIVIAAFVSPEKRIKTYKISFWILLFMGSTHTLFFGQNINTTSTQHKPALSDDPFNSPNVNAYVTVQDSEGITENDMDLNGLKAFEQWVVNTWIEKSKNAIKEMGYNADNFNPKIDSSSVYNIVDGIKLAVIKTNVAIDDTTIRMVNILGIKNNQVTRVMCMRTGLDDIPVYSGVCGEKVTQAFGVSITPHVSVGIEAPPIGETDLNTQMINAARSGDLPLLSFLVEKGADVNAKSASGYTALSGSSGKGHTEIVRFLLDQGANINEKLHNGTNALDEASFWGHTDTVRLLLARGADSNIQKDNGFTPLISAASSGHLEIINVLLKHGANVNATTMGGSTALHVAAKLGHKDIVELLLENGANPSIKNDGGYTYKDIKSWE